MPLKRTASEQVDDVHDGEPLTKRRRVTFSDSHDDDETGRRRTGIDAASDGGFVVVSAQPSAANKVLVHDEGDLESLEKAVEAAKLKRRLRGTEFENEEADHDRFKAKLDDAERGMNAVLDELSDEDDAVASGDDASGEEAASGRKKHWADEENYSHPIEAFNLRDERRDGYFDGTGFYVARKFTRDEQHDVDTWLDDYDQQDSEKRAADQAVARKAHLQQESEKDGAEADSAASLSQTVTQLTTLIDLIPDGENPTTTLRRYAQLQAATRRREQEQKRQRGSKNLDRRKDESGEQATNGVADATGGDMATVIGQITDACENLSANEGEFADVYHLDRSTLQQKLLSLLESQAAARGLLDDMLRWFVSGYFRPSQGCEIRQVSTSSATRASSTKADDDSDDDIFDDVSEDSDADEHKPNTKASEPVIGEHSVWQPSMECALFRT